MGNEIQAHEEKEDGHGEASKDFGPLESERMPYRRAFPDFKVAEDVDHDAEHGAQGVEENEMRQRSEGEGAFGRPERVGCDSHVTYRPPETGGLVFGHGFPAFCERGDW